MSRPCWIVLLLLAGLVSLCHAEETHSFYLIGNSLTQDTLPSLLDGDVQWHVDCGKSLPFIYENPGQPCVKNSTLWPEALKAKQYNVISVQVHYGSNLDSDAAVIVEWPERILDLLPADRLWVTLTYDSPTRRRLRITAGGPRSTILLGDFRKNAFGV